MLAFYLRDGLQRVVRDFRVRDLFEQTPHEQIPHEQIPRDRNPAERLLSPRLLFCFYVLARLLSVAFIFWLGFYLADYRRRENVMSSILTIVKMLFVIFF
eukprot:SAG31_NODE_1038_length_10218_cov_16.418223_2_plen_100_part_00